MRALRALSLVSCLYSLSASSDSDGQTQADGSSRVTTFNCHKKFVQREEVRYIMIVGKDNKNIYNQGRNSAT
jgi:hypothetical protein